MRRAPLFLLALGLMLVVAGAGFALGSIPDSHGVIHGCLNANGGILRVIDTDAGQLCRNNETALDWNQAGPPGPPGPPGLPAPHFIDLQLFGARIGGGAFFTTGFGPHGGLRLPSTGASPNFDFQFTIPADYTTGNTLTLRVVWHTSATNCQMFLRPNSVSVARVGRTHIIGQFASSGLTAVGGEQLEAPSTPNQSGEKLYTITSPVASTPLQPGDNVIFGLFRDLREGTTDNCAADLTIQGVSITY